MSEIEKMYENAGIAKIGTRKCTTCEYLDCQNYCFVSENNKCDKFSYQYPPFTAEKQISLIKFLMKQEDFSWTIAQQGKDTKYVFYVGYEYGSGDFKEFTEAIAGIINDLWQPLTEEERKQIKEILE